MNSITKTCSVEGCTRIGRIRRGWCISHYVQLVSHGEYSDSPAYRHGKYGTSEYRAWYGMIQRCHNSKNQDYHHYGGRGIKVCEMWRNSFIAFYEDMGDKPSARHSIERNNVDGNYEPSNCRWATQQEQMRNIRPRLNSKSGANGVILLKNKRWQVRIGVSGKRIHLGNFVNLQDAIEARKRGEATYWSNTSS